MQIKAVSFPSVSADVESTSGSTYTFTNGYGQMTKAGATVQKGATVTADVDIQMMLISNKTTQSWFNQHKSVFTTEQQNNIQGHLDKENTASGWNAIFAYGAKSSSNENYFQNANAKHEETQTDSQKKVVDSLSELKAENVKVTGHIDIVGTSMLPTTAYIFAIISTVTFEDGTVAHVINQSDPTAATASGDTGSVSTKSGKLHITQTPAS